MKRSFLALLVGDDIWDPSKLAEQVDVLENMPDVAIVNGAMMPTEADCLYLTGGVADRRVGSQRLR